LVPVSVTERPPTTVVGLAVRAAPDVGVGQGFNVGVGVGLGLVVGLAVGLGPGLPPGVRRATGATTVSATRSGQELAQHTETWWAPIPMSRGIVIF
jgi:hypothetical protein